MIYGKRKIMDALATKFVEISHIISYKYPPISVTFQHQPRLRLLHLPLHFHCLPNFHQTHRPLQVLPKSESFINKNYLWSSIKK